MCRTFAGKQNAEHAGVLLQMDRPCRSLQWENWERRVDAGQGSCAALIKQTTVINHRLSAAVPACCCFAGGCHAQSGIADWRLHSWVGLLDFARASRRMRSTVAEQGRGRH